MASTPSMETRGSLLLWTGCRKPKAGSREVRGISLARSRSCVSNGSKRTNPSSRRKPAASWLETILSFPAV